MTAGEAACQHRIRQSVCVFLVYRVYHKSGSIIGMDDVLGNSAADGGEIVKTMIQKREPTIVEDDHGTVELSEVVVKGTQMMRRLRGENLITDAVDTGYHFLIPAEPGTSRDRS